MLRASLFAGDGNKTDKGESEDKGTGSGTGGSDPLSPPFMGVTKPSINGWTK